MALSNSGWKNKVGTSDRKCDPCGSWMDHWKTFAGSIWPSYCAVDNCYSSATLGAHIYHEDVAGERIVPMCNSCNKIQSSLNFKAGTTVVPAIKC